MADSCKCGNELSVPQKCREFFDQLRICWFLRKQCAPVRYLVMADEIKFHQSSTKAGKVQSVYIFKVLPLT